MKRCLVASVLVISAVAHAEPPAEKLPAALIGVSAPWGWFQGTFGASVFIGASRHVAVRANVARYEDRDLAATLGSLGGDATTHGGSVVDGGLAVVVYPRKRFEGLSLELGPLVRKRDTTVMREFDDVRAFDTTSVGGRAMVGWTWTMDKYFFLAVAAGLSLGWESGRETATPELGGMATVSDVGRAQLDAEGYLRVGFVIPHLDPLPRTAGPPRHRLK